MVEQILITVLSLLAGAAVVVVVWQDKRLKKLGDDYASLQARTDELEITYSRTVGELGELQQRPLPERWRGVVRSLALVAVHIAQDERAAGMALYHADPDGHPEGDSSESNYQWRLQQIATAAKVEVETIEQWLAVADAEEK